MSLEIVQKNLRVLVVDDNSAIHEDFRKILCPTTRLGSALAEEEMKLFGRPMSAEDLVPPPEFEMHSAFQGQEGLAAITAAAQAGQPFAMAFVDVRMPPGWDGVETVAHLWDVQPDLQVVICTAYSDYSWSELFSRLGRSDRLMILKKPFDNIEVQQMATALTEKWRLTQEARLRIDDLERRVLERTAELEKTSEQLAQARKMEAVGQLAGGVAHDFNNILTAMLMQLNLLGLSVDLPPGVGEPVRELEKMAKRAAGLTRQLLTFSRRQIVQPKPIDLNEVVANLLKMLERILNENIELTVERAPGGAWMEGDVGMMEQALTNLCMNARDAMQARGGRLRIGVDSVTYDAAAVAQHPERRAGSFVRLVVEDTGCGMDDATRRHLFEPFFTTKAQGKGTGLGLATVYGIAHQHRGWIEVESEVGRGTVFRIHVPQITAPTPVFAPVPPARASAGGCVLVVEDEEMVREMAVLALRHLGYEVLSAVDGPDALRVWQQAGPRVELVFSDMVMPNGMSGLDLARRLKGERPDVKVVITSGYSLDLARAGIPPEMEILFLPKPYQIGELAAAMKQCLKRA